MPASRRTRWLAATACIVAAASAAAWGPWSTPAGADAPPSPAGVWAFRLAVQAAEVPEHNIGVLDLRPDGSCSARMRSSFNGVAHDHEARTCEWHARRPDDPRPALDGAVTLTGVAEPGPTVISFVVADHGKRLLLMLDDTPPAVVGTGEAFRR